MYQMARSEGHAGDRLAKRRVMQAVQGEDEKRKQPLRQAHKSTKPFHVVGRSVVQPCKIRLGVYSGSSFTNVSTSILGSIRNIYFDIELMIQRT